MSTTKRLKIVAMGYSIGFCLSAVVGYVWTKHQMDKEYANK